MDTAVSLKTGIFIQAVRANYQSSREMLLVCPECGEPVHFRVREHPYLTPYFSHYKENYSKACSLRAAGAQFHLPSQLLDGLRRGQLIDRFQKEFSSEIYRMLGDYSSMLIRSLAHDELPNCTQDKFDKISEYLSNLDCVNIFTDEISDSDFRYVDDGLYDISVFLGSGYGRWVGDLLFKTAVFLVNVINKDVIDSDLGLIRYESDGYSALFVLDPKLLEIYPNKFSNGVRVSGSQAKYIDQIVGGIVSVIISHWRVPDICPDLIMVNESVSGDEDAVDDTQDEEEIPPEVNTIRSWRAPDLEFIPPPKDKWFVYRPSKPEPVKVELGPQPLSFSEKNRIMHLCDHGKKIGRPNVGSQKSTDLLKWAGVGYSLDNAIFMAKYCYGLDFIGLEGTDSAKVNRWLDWAKVHM